MKIPQRKAGPGVGGGRGNRDRCRNCDVLEARFVRKPYYDQKIHDAKQTLREVKRELRNKVRELRNKREKMNLILLTVIDICDTGSPKMNRRAIEEKIEVSLARKSRHMSRRNPTFVAENVNLANTIASLVDRYREKVGEFSIDLDEEDEEE
ncbi:uncharacterized protein [Epargyreus clarus]|uniref:uncharacterized protein isoform X2 n=1 Tax=Epargyreus clarus TaxID=520877 RepID=UPI003C305A1C